MKDSKNSPVKRSSLRMSLILLLLLLGVSLSGCLGQKVVVLLDSKKIVPYPGDDTKWCLDKGYFYQIIKTCGVNDAEKPE
ncbi:MAG: hypothetical protein KAR06_04115 [Deltaproteobacteria bacterium]|nr:hypothetical protein [Deltaproteobacteria bacterium]